MNDDLCAGWVARFADEESLCLAALALEQSNLVGWELVSPYPCRFFRGHGKMQGHEHEESSRWRLLSIWGVIGGFLGGMSAALWIHLTQIAGNPLVSQGRVPGWSSWANLAPPIFESLLLGAGLGVVVGILVSGRLLHWYDWTLGSKDLRELASTNGFFVTMPRSCGMEGRAFLENLSPLSLEWVETPPQERCGMAGWWISLVVVILAIGGLMWNVGYREPTALIFNNMREQSGDGYDDQGGVTVPPYSLALSIGGVEGQADCGRSDQLVEFPTKGSSYTLTGRVNGSFGDMLPVELGGMLDSPRLLREGKELYVIHCAVCHGANGDGKGAMMRYPEFPRVEAFWEAKYRNYPLGRMFVSVADGQGNMPAFRTRLTVRQLWSTIWWVRDIQQQGENLKNLKKLKNHE
ncbi:MAG: cytochrome c [Akkermansia sp.]